MQAQAGGEIVNEPILGNLTIKATSGIALHLVSSHGGSLSICLVGANNYTGKRHSERVATLLREAVDRIVDLWNRDEKLEAKS